MSEEEKRVHPRVQLSAEVRISGPRGFETGIMRDLSKGGVAIFLPQPMGSKGDSVEVFLPFGEGVEIAVVAEIVRIQKTPQGVLHSLRYSMVEPAMRGKLSELIEELVNRKDHLSRKHARIAKHLPVKYGKPSELKAILENISLGGLAMTVPSPLVLYEEIDLLIPVPNGKELLILRGRVVHQNPLREGDFTQYRVGLEFKDLSPGMECCLKELIRYLLESNKADEKA